MTHFKHKSLKNLLFLIIAAALLAAGCATGGSGDAAAPAKAAAAAKPDFTQEMGENGLPTPRALLARFIEATGGEDTLRAGQSSTAKGKFMMPAMGMEGDLVLKAKAPNKMVMDIDLGGFGAMNTGFNGTHGWSDNPMAGPQLLEGPMLAELKKQADFFAVFNYDETYPTQETLEQVDFEGMQAYKVRLVDTEGNEATQYFDVETSFMVGTVGTQVSEMGEMEVTTVIGDYKAFGPIKVPTMTTLKMMGMEIQQTVSEINFDPIDDSAFTPPASIQKLIDAQ